MSTHGTRSCSQLERNYYCPGSASLIEFVDHVDGTASPEAQEGTDKHRLTNLMLRGEMLDCVPSKDVQDAVCEVLDIESRIEAVHGAFVAREEVAVDLSALGIPYSPTSNMIDRLIVIPGVGCVVIDYKFGLMPVTPAQWNWQTKGYAWGAWKMFGGQWVWVFIIQPNAEEGRTVSEFVFTDSYIEHEIGPQIKEINDRIDVQPDVMVRGKHCGFCPAKDICPQHRGMVLGIPKHVTVKSHLEAIEPAQRSELYEQVKVAKKWLETALKEIEQCGLSGLEFGGHEVGEGRKSRDWINPIVAYEAMCSLAVENEKSLDDIWSVISPAQAEALFGKSKAVREKLESLIEEKPGKPAMVRRKGNGAIR